MILVTGSSGFLGVYILKELERLQYKVETIGRSSISNYMVDLSTHSPLLTNHYNYVIHAAGKAHSTPRTVEDRKRFFEVNYDGTINLCRALDDLETKPKAFVFISSVAVYGLNSGCFIKEDYPLNGTTAYAQSKIMAEEYLKDWAAKNNVILSILRLPLIAGVNPPGNLGAMINGIRTGRYFSVGKASARKSVVWAPDVALLIPNLLEIGGVYNLTDGYHPSFSELEDSISTALNKSGPITLPLIVANFMAKIGDFVGVKSPINSDRLNKITSDLTFDDSSARDMLNWKPSSVLDKIKDIV